MFLLFSPSRGKQKKENLCELCASAVKNLEEWWDRHLRKLHRDMVSIGTETPL